mgnify:CR=1 FL=1
MIEIAKHWQLIELKTGTVLEGPKELPENWESIFGMRGILDKIGELDWLGSQWEGKGWKPIDVEIEVADPLPSGHEEVEIVGKLLAACDYKMLEDYPITVEEKVKWINYRHQLRNIKHQLGFPDDIEWPVKPE